MLKATDVAVTIFVQEDWLKMRRILCYDDWRLAEFIAANPRGRFVVHKSGHAFAVIDGVLHDWETTTKPTTRIKRVWEVTEETLAKIEKTKWLFE